MFKCFLFIFIVIGGVNFMDAFLVVCESESVNVDVLIVYFDEMVKLFVGTELCVLDLFSVFVGVFGYCKYLGELEGCGY